MTKEYLMREVNLKENLKQVTAILLLPFPNPSLIEIGVAECRHYKLCDFYKGFENCALEFVLLLQSRNMPSLQELQGCPGLDPLQIFTLKLKFFPFAMQVPGEKWPCFCKDKLQRNFDNQSK